MKRKKSFLFWENWVIILLRKGKGEIMCGRVSISTSKDELAEYLSNHFAIEDFSLDYTPRYNVAPGQNLLSVISDGKKYRIGYLKWGFVPTFAKDEQVAMINAKAETINIKPFFKNSFKHKRCLIVANGFYEWQKQANSRIPNRFILNEEKVFTLAGLWSSYTKPDGSKLYTCTIITTDANEVVKPLHDRMPVILASKEDQSQWLNSNNEDETLLSLLRPYATDDLKRYEVSPLVNNPRYDSPDCIKQRASM